jgi:hypothetical protein
VNRATSAKMVYVPPRPNLGPEPMDASAIPPAQLLAILAAFMLLALGVALTARAYRRRRGRRPPFPSLHAPVIDPTEAPGEWMIAWSVALRESLAARFGPAWRAKTTEELAGEPNLSAAIGDESRTRLLAFLAAADRAKFAESDPADLVRQVSEEALRTLSAQVAGVPSGRAEKRNDRVADGPH